MNLQPLEDRIVVRPDEAEEKTVSGLVIPDSAKEKPQQGEVLAIGPGRRAENTGELIPIDLTVGDYLVGHGFAYLRESIGEGSIAGTDEDAARSRGKQ